MYSPYQIPLGYVVCIIKYVQLFTGAENKYLFALFSIPAVFIAWFSAAVEEICPFTHREVV
jgi:hypothetical protein